MSKMSKSREHLLRAVEAGHVSEWYNAGVGYVSTNSETGKTVTSLCGSARYMGLIECRRENPFSTSHVAWTLTTKGREALTKLAAA